MAGSQNLDSAADVKETGERVTEVYRSLTREHYEGALVQDRVSALGLHPNGSSPDNVREAPRCYITSFRDAASTPTVIWNRIGWFLSVIICSVILSGVRDFFQADSPILSAKESATQESTNIVRKRSTCPANNGVDENVYNMRLHVGALFIILSVSTTACAFPILALRFPGLRIPTLFFFAIRHFGTGVLIATAFVHLLPTAFTLLGDSCLPDFWTDKYPAMPGAIALAAIFMLMLIEMVFHPARRNPQGSGIVGGDRADTATPTNTATHPGTMRPMIGRSASIGRRLSRINRPDEEQQILEERKQREEKQRRDMMHCVMLEAGILFHSIFIGMALSVSVKKEFIILLIAIAFHQTFEGLALGSRIADIGWHEEAWKPWLMALAYGCTTPIGQAIGLATHSFYNQDSEVGLLLVGCMNAISAGLLTFQSLVELLSEDFLSDDSWEVLRGRRRVYACLHVVMGAFVMGVVGAWA